MSDILMGRWDCAACEAKGILGDEYRCAGCGSARPDDVVFYLPDDAQVVTDEAGIAAAEAGADWQCAYCDMWVPATIAECPSCAGGDAETGERQEQRDYASRSAVPTSADDPPQAVASAAHVGAAATAPASGGGAGGLLKAVLGGCFLLVLGLCVLGGILGRSAAKVPVTVVGHTWERTCQTEAHRRVELDGWELPADAELIASEERVHHHDKVFDHEEQRTRTETYQEQDGFTTETYTEREQRGTKTETYTERVKSGTRRVKAGVKNLGNGRFKQEYRQEPVYETVTKTRQVPRYENVTKTRQVPRYVTRTRQVPYTEKIYRDVPVLQTHYRYAALRWMPDELLREQGAGLEPRWPEALEDEARRIGARTEVYRLSIRHETDPPRTETYTAASQAVWASYRDGQTFTTGELQEAIRRGDLRAGP